MPCLRLPSRALANGSWISAAAVARLRWSLRVLSVPPAAWRAGYFWSNAGRGREARESRRVTNVDWRQADPVTAALDEYDLLISAFGVMFFGDRVAAFTNMRRRAAPDARMALVCWRTWPKTRGWRCR